MLVNNQNKNLKIKQCSVIILDVILFYIYYNLLLKQKLYY